MKRNEPVARCECDSLALSYVSNSECRPYCVEIDVFDVKLVQLADSGAVKRAEKRDRIRGVAACLPALWKAVIREEGMATEALNSVVVNGLRFAVVLASGSDLSQGLRGRASRSRAAHFRRLLTQVNRSLIVSLVGSSAKSGSTPQRLDRLPCPDPSIRDAKS